VVTTPEVAVLVVIAETPELKGRAVLVVEETVEPRQKQVKQILAVGQEVQRVLASVGLPGDLE
jgi:hypothetical protein